MGNLSYRACGEIVSLYEVGFGQQKAESKLADSECEGVGYFRCVLVYGAEAECIDCGV